MGKGDGKGGEWKAGDRRNLQLYRRGEVFPGSSINRDIAGMSKGDASNGACWFYGEILSYLHLNVKSSFLLIHGSGFAYVRKPGARIMIKMGWRLGGIGWKLQED